MTRRPSGYLSFGGALDSPMSASARWDNRVHYGLTAVLAVLLFAVALVRSPDAQGVVLGLALVILVVCGSIDLRTMRIPNALTYPGSAIVLVAAAASGAPVFTEAALGALVGFGFIACISILSRGSVGMGDAKLSLLGGGLVGIDFVFHALFFGSLAAALFCAPALIAGRIGRRQPIPFGPFLSAGFVAVALVTGGVFG